MFHTGPAVAQMLLEKGAPHAGGAELQLTLIGRALTRCHWEVSFAFDGQGATFPEVTSDGIRLLGMKRITGPPLIRFFTQRIRELSRLIVEANSDIYLQRGVGWQNALLARACRKHKRRFVLWLASYIDALCTQPGVSSLPWYERWAAGYGLRSADVIIAQTYEQGRLLRQSVGRDATVIHNIWPSPLPQLVPPDSPPAVFWAARIIPLKRPGLFLDIAEALPDIRFWMAGGAEKGHEEFFEKVKNRANHMGNVDFLGFVPFAEIDKYYAHSSVYLCTSTVEGFPNTFLQAWSHGRPVVTTFDPDGIVKEHNLGFHCETLGELVPGVENACVNRESYAERVRTYLRENHSPEVIIPQVEAVLRG